MPFVLVFLVEQLIPLDLAGPNRVDTPAGPLRVAIASFDHDLRRVGICVEASR